MVTTSEGARSHNNVKMYSKMKLTKHNKLQVCKNIADGNHWELFSLSFYFWEDMG